VPLSIHLAHRTLTPLVFLLLLVLLLTACGSVADQAASGETPTTTEAPGTMLEVLSTDAGGDPTAFCASFEVLDQHDGTTPEAEAVAALEDVRQTAPESLKSDVTVIVDTMIINDYPSSATSSMERASFEEFDESRLRLKSYVEEHCELAL